MQRRLLDSLKLVTLGKLSSVYGSVRSSLLEKRSKEKDLEMTLSVGKELTECVIFTFWRRDGERHERVFSLMIMSYLV